MHASTDKLPARLWFGILPDTLHRFAARTNLLLKVSSVWEEIRLTTNFSGGPVTMARKRKSFAEEETYSKEAEFLARSLQHHLGGWMRRRHEDCQKLSWQTSCSRHKH